MKREVSEMRYLPYYEVLNLIDGEIADKNKSYSYSQAISNIKDAILREIPVIELKTTVIKK